MADDELPEDPFSEEELKKVFDAEGVPDHPDYRKLVEISLGLDSRMNSDVEEAAKAVIKGEETEPSPLTLELGELIDLDSIFVMSSKRGLICISRMTQLANAMLQNHGFTLAPPVWTAQVAGSSYIDGFLAGYYFRKDAEDQVS